MTCIEEGLEIDRGRPVEPLVEYAVEPLEEKLLDIRLYDCRFVCCSSGRCDPRPLPELRLELLRDTASDAGSPCCAASNDVESAGGVGGLYTSSATVAITL